MNIAQNAETDIVENVFLPTIKDFKIWILNLKDQEMQTIWNEFIISTFPYDEENITLEGILNKLKLKINKEKKDKLLPNKKENELLKAFFKNLMLLIFYFLN